ncbi:2-hydroxymuconate tautomerase [Corynebacterium occultum]|uniref:2-hydroxymuconate tautomerase n=1 Tax=Corynebacterium occultum TaxID=2675219 RepID=A0A6B8W3R6_9CORY|nr:tautomerase family protein [Corynebacterium occultum]QGU06045.1 2-hydroxymuconate tautomerase [Corynebacterium occultum]
MPIIQVTLIEGREDAVVENFIREVARTAAETLDAPLSSVRVMVNTVAPNYFAVGDQLKSE